MTTEPNPQPDPAWGDPAPAPAAPKQGWSGKKTAIAAGIAVVIAAGGGLAIWAGTGSADNTTQGPGGMPGGGRFIGPPGAMGELRNALHGDFVVADPNGGYTTERLQTGEVTELSATSVTVTSKDGYKQTYVLDGSTQKSASVKQGSTNVTVVAKVSGTTATATSLGVEQGQRMPGQRRGDDPARPTN